MRGTIHHLDLTVRDPRASHGFYAAVLGFMGYREVADHDRGFDYDLATRDGFTSIGIMKASGPNAGREHDRYSPGLHHVAWNAASRKDVDDMHALLLKIGAAVVRNTRRIRLLLASAHPMKHVFLVAARALAP